MLNAPKSITTSISPLFMAVCYHGDRYFNLVGQFERYFATDCIEFELHIFCSLGTIRLDCISPRISDQQFYDQRHF